MLMLSVACKGLAVMQLDCCGLILWKLEKFNAGSGKWNFSLEGTIESILSCWVWYWGRCYEKPSFVVITTSWGQYWNHCRRALNKFRHARTWLLFAYKRSSSKHCFATECVSRVVSSNVAANTRIQSSIAKNWKVAYDGNWGWGRGTYSVNGPWAWFLSSLYLLQWGISVRMGCRPSCLSTCSINSGLATFTTTNGPYFDTHSGP